jgi:hypothetical protein
MSFRVFRRVVILAVGVATTTGTSVLLTVAGPGATTPASAATNVCPTSKAIGNFLTADIVTSSFTYTGTRTTYKFTSLNEIPVIGVPWLIK